MPSPQASYTQFIYSALRPVAQEISGKQSAPLAKCNREAWTHLRTPPDKLYLYVSENENGYDRIYDAREELSEPNRLKAKTFKAVISRLGAGLDYGSTILQHLTENLAIYFPQTADGLLTARTPVIR